MQKYTNSVADSAGNVIYGASVTVTIASTGVLASLYADSAGTTVLANPLTTDNYGMFSFYADDGKYNITISNNNIQSYTINDLTLIDIESMTQSDAINGTSLFNKSISPFLLKTGTSVVAKNFIVPTGTSITIKANDKVVIL